MTAQPPDVLPRGTCPRCASAELTHVVWGMPSTDALDGAPAWITFGGCVIPARYHDRVCSACGLAWLATEDGTGMMLQDWAELRDFAGVATDQEVADWASEELDPDVFLEQVPHELDPEGVLGVRVGVYGVGLTFGFPLGEFWETLEELEERFELDDGDDGILN